jgi:mono/diheme cytochrome c family protein
MPKLITIALMAGLTSAALCGMAQQTTPKIKDVPIQPTSPASGQQMYASYCAVCHGVDGTGNGPAGPAKKANPTDLTTLSKQNGGKFPYEQIEAILKFGVANPAHGSAEMPIWGDLFRTLPGQDSVSNMAVDQRIINLTTYLRQIQK